ncbi:c-type cytochrome [Rhizobium laguerreae]|uniref:c-type cytochrome n=1 Tax=Rhizobium laguerreae TaxID=1076926 RepID=UPI00103F4FA0|nr:cytochrome c family protein [Rhizobium laguerreae]TBX99078.1 cytochrome c family protein [Rhizobium laguerreae]
MKLFVAAIVYLLPITVCFAGSAEKGEVIFKKCAACHNIDKPENKVGPHLVVVLGRKAGSINTYEYSAPMKKVGADGMVWDEETLRNYLAAPKKFIPGSRMSFTGLNSGEDIGDLLEYMKSKWSLRQPVVEP